MFFAEDDVLYILEEFESYQMSPSESAKNGPIGAHGLNCKIFFNSELIFESYDKNYLIKKISFLSDNFENFVIQPGRSLSIKPISPHEWLRAQFETKLKYLA